MVITILIITVRHRLHLVQSKILIFVITTIVFFTNLFLGFLVVFGISVIRVHVVKAISATNVGLSKGGRPSTGRNGWPAWCRFMTLSHKNRKDMYVWDQCVQSKAVKYARGAQAHSTSIQTCVPARQSLDVLFERLIVEIV